MLLFFCSICIDDVEAHPDSMNWDDAFVNCPKCGAKLATTYTKPLNPDVKDLTIENYNKINGLTE